MLIINVILLFSFAFLGTRQVIWLFTGIFLKFVFSMLCVQWTKSGNKSAEVMVNCGHLCDCYKSSMLDCFVWSIPSTFVKSFMYNSALYTSFFLTLHTLGWHANVKFNFFTYHDFMFRWIVARKWKSLIKYFWMLLRRQKLKTYWLDYHYSIGVLRWKFVVSM